MSELQEGLISHLIELRSRLMKAIGAMLLTFLCLVPWSGKIYDLLAQPMMANLPAGTKMIATGVITPFLVPLKVTLLAAFVIALPVMLYQAWAFVAPGLYANERKLTGPLLVASVALFFTGMAFAFFIVFPTVFTFVNKFAPDGVAIMTDIDKYLSFVMTTFLAFGVTFEVPVIVIMLVKAGILSVEKLKEIRPYVIVGAFVIGALFTPPDILSQFLLAVPLLLLYEAGILIAGMLFKPEASDTETNALTRSK